MLLDVLPLVRDATGRNDRLLEDLKANFAAQIVGHFALLSTIVDFGEEIVQLSRVACLQSYEKCDEIK